VAEVRRYTAPVLLGILILCGACGYRFAGQGDLPSSIRRIQIPLLTNQSGITGIETTFTNDLIYEFTRTSRASARLVGAEAEADAVLKGRIGPIAVRTITHRGHQVALERRVTVSLSVTIVSLEGTVIWSVEDLTDHEAYPVSEDTLATEHNRREAIIEISQRMAETVYNGFTTNF
jgi:outer membrane lipopolysaccharide assembly protein LptE/RlpB